MALPLQESEIIRSDCIKSDEEGVEENSPAIEGVVKEYLWSVQRAISGQTKYGKPRCCDNGTFWIRPTNPVLQKDHLPDGYYYPDVFVWIPDLVGEVKLICPTCSKSDRVVAHGYPSSVPARRVVSLNQCYYILSRRYICQSCNRTFLGHNQKVLQALPTFVSAMFPAYLTARSGLDKKVVTMLRALFNKSVGPEPFSNLLKELHTLRHHQLMYNYYSVVNHRRALGSVEFNATNHLRFSTFDDQSGYAGFTPSAGYLRDVYLQQMREIRTFQDLEVMMRSSKILKGDDSHKVSIRHCGSST
jgi:hypothetical protein